MDENSVQSLGFINRLKNRLSQVNQRTAFDAFIVVLILIGLAASVYLAGQRQIFRSRAAQNGSAEVVDEQGNAMPKEGENFIVETQQIRLKIIPPTTWNQPQGYLPQLRISVYAQSGSCGSTWTDGRPTSCYPDSSAPASGCAYLWAWSRDDSNPNKESSTCGTDAPYCWACPAQQPAPTPTPTPQKTLLPNVSQGPTCESLGGKCGRNDKYIRGEGLTCSNGAYQGYNDGSKFSDCDTTDGEFPYCWTGCETFNPGATGSCRDLRPDEAVSPPTGAESVDPSSYIWKAIDCSRPCTRNSNCPQIDNGINAATSNWCYGFEEGKRCLQLQYIGGRGGVQEPSPTPPPVGGPPAEEETTQSVRISLNQDSVKKDGSCTESSDLTQTCKEITTLDLSAKGNIIDWKLPSQAGNYTIYIGFISDKGNFKDPPLLVPVKYEPKGGTISGKLKIIANGVKYKEVEIFLGKITKENPPIDYTILKKINNFDFSNQLPTDQNQEANYTFANLTETKYVLFAGLRTEEEKAIFNLSKTDCPSNPLRPEVEVGARVGCLVQTGATDANLTLEIPPAGQAAPTTSRLPENFILKTTLHLQGVGNGQNQNRTPRHTERDIAIRIYAKVDENYKPMVYTGSGKIVYSPSLGAFTADFYVPLGDLRQYLKVGQRLFANIGLPSDAYLDRTLSFSLDIETGFWNRIFTTTAPCTTKDCENLKPLFAGDVNSDNIIDAKDLKIIEEDCLGAKWQTASCKYKDTADVNDDGKVDGVDANYVRVNLGKKGAD